MSVNQTKSLTLWQRLGLQAKPPANPGPRPGENVDAQMVGPRNYHLQIFEPPWGTYDSRYMRAVMSLAVTQALQAAQFTPVNVEWVAQEGGLVLAAFDVPSRDRKDHVVLPVLPVEGPVNQLLRDYFAAKAAKRAILDSGFQQDYTASNQAFELLAKRLEDSLRPYMRDAEWKFLWTVIRAEIIQGAEDLRQQQLGQMPEVLRVLVEDFSKHAPQAAVTARLRQIQDDYEPRHPRSPTATAAETEAPAQPLTDGHATLICTACQAHQPLNNKFCSVCGAALL